jgi:hypothetical protein
MLALLAAFILALFKVTVPFNLVTLGLAVLALHLARPIAIRGRRRGRKGRMILDLRIANSSSEVTRR